MRRTILLYFLMSLTIMATAQKLTVKAPSQVPAGETFRVEYTVNTVNVKSPLRLGNIPDAFEIVFGPSESRQESYTMYNGHTSSVSSITITYMLVGNKSGTFTIPPARIEVGGRIIASEPARITVTGNPRQQKNGATKFYNENDNRPQLRSAGSSISDKDLFIRVSANKNTVYEQEPILLTYKVYSLVDLSQLEGKMPDLTGFHSQALPLPQQKVYSTETIDGRRYRTVVWSQYIMYPQITGRLEIPSITFKGVVIQENRHVDPYEAFLNGGSGYIEVKREIKAPGLFIQVEPLPKKPANFSGGVGKFHITAQLDKNEVKAGDPISLRVIVGGAGNLKLLKQPVVTFPKDFDKYDAKVTDKTRLTQHGVEGNMVYDFTAIPRNQGKYLIPAVELTYYDTAAKAYKTVKSSSFEINVLKGSGNSTMSDFSDFKDKDIQGIKTDDNCLHAPNEFFYGSTGYWVGVVLPFVVFILLLIVFRKRALEHADIVKMRGKNADKVAGKRLKRAHGLMRTETQGAFYDEVLRALWGYVGDKMNLPVEELSRDNVADKLSKKGISEDIVRKFLAALDECEYARYAPENITGNMQKTFDTAMNAITNIENSMKQNRSSAKGFASLMLLLALLLAPSSSMAVATKANGDAEYAKGNYMQAIKDYEEVLKKGVSADLYYNLGNAYYRTDNITRAVINYERALLLSPGDEDIRFNLRLARSKTIDKITPESEMFFVTWYKALVNSTSVDTWAYRGIAAIIISLLLVLLYLFARPVWMRKVGFFGAACFLLLFFFANLFAYQQKSNIDQRTGAIVISSAAGAKKTPADAAASIFVLHEGTRVDVTDNTMKDWKAIRLEDGREGWIESKHLEFI